MKWIKRFLFLVAFGILLYLFWPLVKDLRQITGLLRTAKWAWLVAAFVIQIISYCFLTWLNLLSLQPFPGDIKFLTMASTLTAIAFIETAIPSAGLSGVALRAHLLKKNGAYDLAASTFTLGVESVFIAIAMASIGILGLVYLTQSGEINPLRIVIIVMLGFMISIGLWISLKLIQNPIFLDKFVHGLALRWNTRIKAFTRLPQLKPLDPQQTGQRLREFQKNLIKLRQIPLWKFFLAAYSRVILDVATLGLCFQIFGYKIPPRTLFTGYGLILLTSGLSSLPGGLGLTDVSVPVIFSRLGAGGVVALAAGLSYRLIAFWLLRFIGFINWMTLETNIKNGKQNRPAL